MTEKLKFQVDKETGELVCRLFNINVNIVKKGKNTKFYFMRSIEKGDFYFNATGGSGLILELTEPKENGDYESTSEWTNQSWELV